VPSRREEKLVNLTTFAVCDASGHANHAVLLQNRTSAMPPLKSVENSGRAAGRLAVLAIAGPPADEDFRAERDAVR
jgi:hypothetical protein